MALPSIVVDALVEAGCTAAQIAAAIRAAEAHNNEAAMERRERDRIRKRKEREQKSSIKTTTASEMSRGRSVTECDTPSPLSPPDKETPPTPPKEINPPISPQPQKRDGSLFDAFWAEYPNKVGKADARKKFDVALKLVSFDELMAGLGRYVAKTDDRPWCNPSTWLHQERWSDQPANVHPRGSPSVHSSGIAGAFTDLLNQMDRAEDDIRRQSGHSSLEQDVPYAAIAYSQCESD